MNGALISLILVLAVLAGCPETPTETAVDVAPAREDAAQDVKEARRNANDAVADATEVITDAHQVYAKTEEIKLK